MMCNFHSFGCHLSRNLSFSQKNSADLTGYSNNCDFLIDKKNSKKGKIDISNQDSILKKNGYLKIHNTVWLC